MARFFKTAFDYMAGNKAEDVTTVLSPQAMRPTKKPSTKRARPSPTIKSRTRSKGLFLRWRVVNSSALWAISEACARSFSRICSWSSLRVRTTSSR